MADQLPGFFDANIEYTATDIGYIFLQRDHGEIFLHSFTVCFDSDLLDFDPMKF